MSELSLGPVQVLQYLEAHTKDKPQGVVQRYRASIGGATHADVEYVWQELADTYGSSQRISKSIDGLIEKFPVIVQGPEEGDKLRELHELCRIIQHNMANCPDLSVFNLGRGLKPLRGKLSFRLQNEWGKVGQPYEESHYGQHPPFSLFVDFLRRQAKLKSNQHYLVETTTMTPRTSARKDVKIMKTDIDSTHDSKVKYCIFHKFKSSFPRSLSL